MMNITQQTTALLAAIILRPELLDIPDEHRDAAIRAGVREARAIVKEVVGEEEGTDEEPEPEPEDTTAEDGPKAPKKKTKRAKR